MERYRGKLFSLLGDSISALEGYSTPEGAAFYEGRMKWKTGVCLPEDTWWGQMIHRLGGRLLVNNSIAGSTVSIRPGYCYPSYGCSDERTSSLGDGDLSPDVILVFLGMNDWGRGVRLYPEAGEEKSLFFFVTAYEAMLDKLRAAYPHAEIVCFTFPISEYTKDPAFAFPYRYGGRHMEEYCRVIGALAQEKGCVLLDLYGEGVRYDTVDRFHPNREGMTALADEAVALLEKRI